MAATEDLLKGIGIYIWCLNEESFDLLIRHSCSIENHSVTEPPPKSASQIRFLPNEVRPYIPQPLSRALGLHPMHMKYLLRDCLRARTTSGQRICSTIVGRPWKSSDNEFSRFLFVAPNVPEAGRSKTLRTLGIVCREDSDFAPPERSGAD